MGIGLSESVLRHHLCAFVCTAPVAGAPFLDVAGRHMSMSKGRFKDLAETALGLSQWEGECTLCLYGGTFYCPEENE